MLHNLHSRLCYDVMYYNICKDGDDIGNIADTNIFILDLSNYYIHISNLFHAYDNNIREAVTKIILEDMIFEYASNEELEGGTFIENMNTVIEYDIGCNELLLKVEKSDLMDILLIQDEYLDTIYGEIYGILSHITNIDELAIPLRWLGNNSLDMHNVTVKIMLYSEPNIVLGNGD